MGQRQQIFIRVKNPMKNEEFLKNVQSCCSDKKEVARAKRFFGNKKYSILALHNQWLYGLSSVSLLINIMNEVKNAKGEYHPFSLDFNNPPHPKDIRTGDKIDGYIETVLSLIDNQHNSDIADMTGRFGSLNSYFMNEECYDKNGKKKYQDVRENFFYVDNNDGILIVDTITQKYCYMNIGGDSTVEKLPRYKPVSALEYISAYYPTKKEHLGSTDITDESKTLQEIYEELKEHKPIAELVVDLTETYQVLTEKELLKITPTTFKEIYQTA